MLLLQVYNELLKFNFVQETDAHPAPSLGPPHRRGLGRARGWGWRWRHGDSKDFVRAEPDAEHYRRAAREGGVLIVT